MNRIHSRILASLTLAVSSLAAPAAFVSSPLNLSSLTSFQGLVITNSSTPSGETGYTVARVGDVNGDGIPDFVVTTFHHDSVNGGPGIGIIYISAAYVVFGQESVAGNGGFPANLDLASLDGSNGFVILHEATVNSNAAAMVGYSVSAAGDVNGDGIADLIVGVPGYGVSGNGTTAGGGKPGTGGAFVIFGRTGSFPAVIDPFTDLDGSNGFAMVGETSGDAAGASVSAAGDVTGAGVADIIIGAPNAASGAGAAYVVLGHANPFPAILNLSTLDGTNGFKITGATAGDHFGTSVSTVSNFEGEAERSRYLIVGAPGANSGAGAAYVVPGSSVSPSTATPSFTIGAVSLVVIQGGSAGDQLGASVSGAGDLTGDGLGDLIIGAPGVNSGAGAAYVIYGQSNPRGSVFPGTATVSFFSGGLGFKFSGVAAGDRTGASVAIAGDVNGDGLSDLIIGAPGANSGAGAAYVVFGQAGKFASSLSLSGLTGANGLKIAGVAAGDSAGSIVSGAGDVNGDGYDDLIVGAPFASSSAGAAYVIYGGPSGLAPSGSVLQISNGAGTFTDVDGDVVTVKVGPQLQAANFDLIVESGGSGLCQCLGLNLGQSFEGSNIKITVKRGPHGDGKVNIGYINATGVDLGAVSVPGDLGRISAGSGAAGKTALKSLTVDSLGAFGGRTEDTGSDHGSVIVGPVGAIKIAGDVREALLAVFDGSTAGTGKIASLFIGGSLIGGATTDSGVIYADTSLGVVSIRGDILGGGGASSGSLETDSTTSLGISSLQIGGSLVGGSGGASGTVAVGGSIRNVSITDDELGGAGGASGSILTGADTVTGSMGKIHLGGSQVGGAGVESGLIYADGPGSNIASVTIGGDARGGAGFFSGGLIAGAELGPVVVKGSIIGQPGNSYTLRGGGVLSGPKSVALASLTAGGNLENALLLAGFGPADAPMNGHAQIGAISVGGKWIASSVSAGAVDAAGGFSMLGAGGEKLISNGSDTSTAMASIASIVIKGSAIGSFTPGERFGIIAQEIGAVTIEGVKLPLLRGPGNDTAGLQIGPASNFILREVAPQ